MNAAFCWPGLRQRTGRAIAAAAVALAPSCSKDFRECETVSDATLGRLPDALSGTGLYSDIATKTLTPGVIAFTPRFPLWSDGAEKQRWLALPDGATIDASDVDSWRFPEGTKAWKEFAIDGVPVETRMIEKIGPDAADWAALAYRWDGADATAVRDGQNNVSGTSHDIPTAEECVACHGGRSSFLLGFSAVQLAGTEGVSVESLVADGLLAPAPGPISAPADDEAALGYLHANCSHCHNPDRAVGGLGKARCYDPNLKLDWTLPAAVLSSASDAPALKTGKDQLGGGGQWSEVLERMSDRNQSEEFASMPPLGTERADDDGVALLKAWIDGL